MGLLYVKFECHLMSTAIIEVTFLVRKFSAYQTLCCKKISWHLNKNTALVIFQNKKIFALCKSCYTSLKNLCFFSKALLSFFSKLHQSNKTVAFFESNLFMTYILYTSYYKIQAAFMSNIKFYVDTLNTALQ